MKLKRPAILKTATRAGIIMLCAGIIFLFRLDRSLNTDWKVGSQGAVAAATYGILGRPAPEIYLDTWVDGVGKRMKPVKLGAHRGKVIYLFFFQNW